MKGNVGLVLRINKENDALTTMHELTQVSPPSSLYALLVRGETRSHIVRSMYLTSYSGASSSDKVGWGHFRDQAKCGRWGGTKLS